jgi:hypothetical protein
MFSTSQNYSKSYNFLPSTGEIIVSAFTRIGVRRTELQASHVQDGVMELNLLFSKMDNMGPNLWTVDMITLPLVQAAATYSVPAETIMILDAFISTVINGVTNDRLIFPLSRTEYAAIPNKTEQGFPSQFWFDRVISPTITMWLVPDSNGPYTLKYFRYRQIQDGVITNGFNPEVPVRWLDALVAGLAHRLARLYAPQLEAVRKADADEAWGIAATQDVVNTPMAIFPGLAGYYR